MNHYYRCNLVGGLLVQLIPFVTCIFQPEARKGLLPTPDRFPVSDRGPNTQSREQSRDGGKDVTVSLSLEKTLVFLI